MCFKYAVLILVYFLSVFPCVPERPGMPCPGEDSECVYIHIFEDRVIYDTVAQVKRNQK